MAERRRIPETLFDDLGFRMTYEVKRVIYELETEHQHLVLFEYPFFGKMLMLDGATQVTTVDEFVYHEMMSHVPLLAHGHAEEVLIVGGGDCGVAEEVLKHKSVKRLTQVEIDASVIEFSKRHFPEFTKPVFADAYCYVAAIPTYVGGHLAIGWATDNVKLRHASLETITSRYDRAGRFPTKYWTPEVHVAAFALPRFIAEKVAKGMQRRSTGAPGAADRRFSGKASPSRRRS